MYLRDIPEELHQRLRVAAAVRGEPMRSFVIEAIKERLDRLGIEVPETNDQDR